MASSRPCRRGSSGSEDRVPAPPAQETDRFDVMEIVDFLRKNLPLLGLMGMEFVFFHQFFNEKLQRWFRELRQQLYGSGDPPMPMTLDEAERTFISPVGPMMEELEAIADRRSAVAAAVRAYARDYLRRRDLPASVDVQVLGKVLAGELLARSEKDDGLRRILQRLSYHHMFFTHVGESIRRLRDEINESGLAEHACGHFSLGTPFSFDILAKPIPEPLRSKKMLALLHAANQLHELAITLPANDESLSMAVVCGTPPVPPMSVISIVLQPSAPVEVHLKVYSAKLRGLARGYQIATEKFCFQYGSPSESPPIDVAWSDTYPPYLEMRITPRNGVVPRPSQVAQAFKRARRGKRFYDSNTKVKDYDLELDAWAKATLSLACGMANREVQAFWAEQVEDEPREDLGPEYKFLWSRTTTSQDVVLYQQIRRISTRIQEMRSLTRI